MENKVKLEISTTSVLKIIGLVILVCFLYYIREILVLLFIVLIIVMALEPVVTYLSRYKIPRVASVAIIYIILLAVLSLFIYLIIPPVVDEIRSLTLNLPTYAYKFNFIYQFLIENSDWQKILINISSGLSRLSGGVYNATLAIFGGITSAITVVVLSFYLLLEKTNAKNFLVSLIPESKRKELIEIIHKISYKLGAWLRGQIVVSLIFGLAVAVALAIIGVPYALTIGLIAGILEIIPIIGAIISGILTVLITLLTGSWLQALIVLIVYIILQQLENHLLIPKVMQKAVGLSPVVIIIALLVGAKLAGVIGAVLAIPVAAGLSVLIAEWVKLKGNSGA